MAADATLEQRKLALKRELLKRKLQEQQSQTVFRQDTQSVVKAPTYMKANEIKYHDDVKNRGKDPSWYNGFVEIPGDVMQGFLRGVAQSGDFLSSLSRDEKELQRVRKKQEGEDLSFTDWLMMKRKPVWADADTFYAQREQELVNRIARSKKGQEQLPKVLDNMGLKIDNQVAGDLGQGAQSLVQSIGLGMVSKNKDLAALVFAGQEKARTYYEGRQAGLSVNDADTAANISAAGNFMIEKIGTAALFKAFSEGTFVKRAVKGFLTEGTQEGAQEIWGILVKNGYDITDTSFNEAAGQALYAFVLGGVLGGPVAGFAGPSIDDVSRQTGIPKDDLVQIKNIAEEKISKSDQVQEALVKEAEELVEAEFNGVGADNAIDPNSPIASIEEDQDFDIETEIDRAIELKNQKDGIFSAPTKFMKGTNEGIARFAEPISSRIRQISPQVMYKLRRMEMDMKSSIQQTEQSFVPFLKKYSSLTSDQQVEVDFILKNGTQEQIESMAERYNMVSEIDQVRSSLDSVYERAQEANIDVQYRSDFFPRSIRDLDGLLAELRKDPNWNIFQRAFDNKQKSLNRDLTDQEKADIVNTLLRGFKTGGISLKDAGVFQERTLEKINADLNQYYETTDQALLKYGVVANENIETKRFFGKYGEGDDSIGNLVNDLVDNGEIDATQSRELKDVLSARFNRRRMGEVGETFKNVMYIETMGSNIGSTITQIGDLALTVYKNNLKNTVSAIPKAFKDDTVFNLDDMGVTRIAQEFEGKTWSSKVLEKAFEATGLAKIDRFSKRTLVQSSYNKYKKLADQSDPVFLAQLRDMYGVGANAVLQDLKNNRSSDDVKFLLFNDLLDMQPVALSEMPQIYLTSNTGKLFYVLKSFTLKQIDIYRRDGVQKIKSGFKSGSIKDVRQGTQNIVTLLTLMTTAGVSRDYIWSFLKDLPDMIFEDEEPELPEIEDAVINNMLKAFGLNKYTFDQMARPYMPETAVGAFWNYILPPSKTADNMWMDFNDIKDGDLSNPAGLRTLRSVPVGGELYWYWFGQDINKEKSDENKSLDDYKNLLK